MCREELQSGRWQVETGKWQTANGNRRYAVAHIIIALIYGSIFAANYFAPTRPKTKIKGTRNGNHMECASFPTPATAAELVQIPCPARACVPAKLPSSPTKVAPVAVVIAVPRRGTFNCRSNATFCSVHELKQTRFHQFQVELVQKFVNTTEKLSFQKVRIIRASKEILIQ